MRNVSAKLLAVLLLVFACACAAPGLAFADELGSQSTGKTVDSAVQVAPASATAATAPAAVTTQAVAAVAPAATTAAQSATATDKAEVANASKAASADSTKTAEPAKAADAAKGADKASASNANDKDVSLNTEAAQKKEDAAQQAEPAKATQASAAKQETAKKETAKDASSADLQTQEAYPKASVKFRVHVQNDGNQSWRTEYSGDDKEARAGTSGRSLRLEGLWMELDAASAKNSSIEYQVHVQNVGWQNVKKNGQMAGTSGKAYRLEGLRIALTGELSRYYDIAYRVHVQNVGWQDYVTNGAFAGTEGRGLRLEAMDVKLVKKASVLSKSQDGLVGLTYRGHVQNIGWQSYENGPATAGTSGQALRVEALQIYLNSGRYSGGIQYQAHVQNIGWQSWKGNGAIAGTSGRGLRVEALKVQLTGDIANYYDIAYRAHVQNIGWQPWTVDGNIAGTAGRALRVEALQLKLMKKGSQQNLGEGTYVITLANDVNNELAVSGTQAKKAAYSTTNAAGKFYVRNENGGITIQSVSTGKFLADTGSAALQAWQGSAPQVWSLLWNGGYKVVNKATGEALALAGNTATTSIDGSPWMFSSVKLVDNGNYVLKNKAKGNVLDVQNASYSSGANLMVHNANGGGNQVFAFSDLGNGYYWVTNAMSYKGIEVVSGSKSNGANVHQYNSNSNSANQQWKPSLDRDGNFIFTNRASGKVLTAVGAGTQDANVVSSTDAGNATQRWSMIASSYRGNPALPRAIEMAKRLSSKTDWLITLDRTNHWLVIFHWTNTGWEMYHNWKVSIGAPATPTPLGSYKVYKRVYTFGDSYSVYYATAFLDEFYFHSIKYHHGTRSVKDGRLGKNISMGCVRMAIEDAKWIYDNIPNGTKVRIYD